MTTLRLHHQASPGDLIKQINETAYPIGAELLLTHHTYISNPLINALPNITCWSDGNAGFFILTPTYPLLPLNFPLSLTSPIQKVHDAGDAVAVWKVGEAFVKAVNYPDFMKGATLEHVTIDALHTKKLSFRIPEVIHYVYWDEMYFIITTAMEGVTLDKAWLSMDQEMKESYADRVVDICQELAKFEADYIGGFDGGTSHIDLEIEPATFQSDDHGI